MWTIIKIDKKNLEFFKKDFKEKIGEDFSIYIPKLAIQKYKKNKLIYREIDLMGDYFSDGIPPDENLENILKEFRNVGLKIVGCASHGSSRMRKALGLSGSMKYPTEYVNYRIWEECCGSGPLGWEQGKKELCAGGRHLDIPAFSLESYGLRYEAYHVTRHWYFSDSGGKYWLQNGDKHSFSHPYEAFSVMKEGEVMQILVHPIWWQGSFK